jgi:hypothetical protein
MGALVRGADARYIARVPSRFRCRSFCRTRRRQRTPCRKSRRRTYNCGGRHPQKSRCRKSCCWTYSRWAYGCQVSGCHYCSSPSQVCRRWMCRSRVSRCRSRRPRSKVRGFQSCRTCPQWWLQRKHRLGERWPSPKP